MLYVSALYIREPPHSSPMQTALQTRKPPSKLFFSNSPGVTTADTAPTWKPLNAKRSNTTCCFMTWLPTTTSGNLLSTPQPLDISRAQTRPA
eukprot:3503798-Rhodomonas_salina.1